IDCHNLPHAAGDCSSGACVVANTCNSGFGDCDHLRANGCEDDLNSDARNCGSCGNFCFSGNCFQGSCCSINCNLPNANTSCNGGFCSITSCKPGFADCDGNVFNGCEVNLTCGFNNSCSFNPGCIPDTDRD